MLKMDIGCLQDNGVCFVWVTGAAWPGRERAGPCAAAGQSWNAVHDKRPWPCAGRAMELARECMAKW